VVVQGTLYCLRSEHTAPVDENLDEAVEKWDKDFEGLR